MTVLRMGDATPLDAEGATEGKWFDLRTAPGVRVRLRYWGNRDAEAARDREALVVSMRYPDYFKAIEKGEITEEMEAFAQQLRDDTTAHYVLVDWEGVKDADGEPIAYTPEFGLQFLSDRRWDIVRRELIRLATTSADFMERQEADVVRAVGNGRGGSSGTGKSSGRGRRKNA